MGLGTCSMERNVGLLELGEMERGVWGDPVFGQRKRKAGQM